MPGRLKSCRREVRIYDEIKRIAVPLRFAPASGGFRRGLHGKRERGKEKPGPRLPQGRAS